jgi:predicted transcriptional regulator
VSKNGPSWSTDTRGTSLVGLGTLEAELLAAVWAAAPQPVSVRDIYEELLTQRRIAYTTVMTVMGNLTKKGLLACDRSKFTYLYSAAIPGETIAGEVLDTIVARLYRGRAEAPVSHLLALEATLTADQFEILRSHAQALLAAGK